MKAISYTCTGHSGQEKRSFGAYSVDQSVTQLFSTNIRMWEPIIEESEFTKNGILCRHIQGKKLLVVRDGTMLYSCGAICPHQGFSMENGLVFDEEITCAEHSWTFSLKTGELTYPGNGPRIPIYPIRVNDGMIEVEVPQAETSENISDEYSEF